MVQSYSVAGGNVSSHEGTLTPLGEYDWTCASFGPPESTTRTANRSVQPFLHRSRQKVFVLYNGRPYIHKNCRFLWVGYEPPCNAWFPGPIGVYNPSGHFYTANGRVSSGRLAIDLANTSRLVHASAQSSLKPKRQIDRFSRFCTAHGRKSLYFTNVRADPPKIAPSHADLDPI